MVVKNIIVNRCGCSLRRVVTMVIVDKGDKYHKPIEREEVRWEIQDYCKAHYPNHRKKGDRFINNVDKNTKRRKFLEQRQKIRKLKKNKKK